MEEKKDKTQAEKVHLCFSDSGRGSLKYGISQGLLKGNRVFCFADDLSNGPVQGLDKPENRASWWKSLYTSEFEDMEEYFLQNYMEFEKELECISTEEICIWYGGNNHELCGLLYGLSRLKDKRNQITLINVSERTFNLGKVNQYTPRGIGELPPENLGDYLTLGKTIEQEEYAEMMEKWDRLIKENSLLRVFDGNEITNVPIGYYDEYILSFVEDKYRKCARTVGEALGNSMNLVSDSFIFWRILEMIKSEKVQCIGKLGIMREMEIKKGGY